MSAAQQLAIATRGFRTGEAYINRTAIATRGFRLPGQVVIPDLDFIITQALVVDTGPQEYTVSLLGPQSLVAKVEPVAYILELAAQQDISTDICAHTYTLDIAPQEAAYDIATDTSVDTVSYISVSVNLINKHDLDINMDDYLNSTVIEHSTESIEIPTSMECVSFSYSHEDITLEVESAKKLSVEYDPLQSLTIPVLKNS